MFFEHAGIEKSSIVCLTSLIKSHCRNNNYLILAYLYCSLHFPEEAQSIHFRTNFSGSHSNLKHLQKYMTHWLDLKKIFEFSCSKPEIIDLTEGRHKDKVQRGSNALPKCARSEASTTMFSRRTGQQYWRVQYNVWSQIKPNFELQTGLSSSVDCDWLAS